MKFNLLKKLYIGYFLIGNKGDPTLVDQQIQQLVNPQINALNQVIQAVQSLTQSNNQDIKSVQSLAQLNQQGVQTIEQIVQRVAHSVNDLFDLQDRDIAFQGNQIKSFNRLLIDLINRLKNAGINI